MRPVCAGWTFETLKEREKLEMDAGGFGLGDYETAEPQAFAHLNAAQNAMLVDEAGPFNTSHTVGSLEDCKKMIDLALQQLKGDIARGVREFGSQLDLGGITERWMHIFEDSNLPNLGAGDDNEG